LSGFRFSGGSGRRHCGSWPSARRATGSNRVRCCSPPATSPIQEGSFALQPERGEGEIVAGPGTLLGESALLAETTRPATATAREPSAVLRISRTMFRKMLEGYPEAAHRLREVIAARADQWARDMENVRDALAPRNKPR
jgi:hypothetical protein